MLLIITFGLIEGMYVIVRSPQNGTDFVLDKESFCNMFIKKINFFCLHKHRTKEGKWFE